MIKKEELAKQYAEYEYCSERNDTPRYRIAQIHAAIGGYIAGWDEALKNQWVKVEDAMPEKCKIVIVLHSDMTVGVSEYHCDNNWSNFEDDIIAWMPIPSFDDIIEANKNILKRLKNK